MIKSVRCCPHRLGDQDAALSRLKPEFESLWGHWFTRMKPLSSGFLFTVRISVPSSRALRRGHLESKNRRKAIFCLPIGKNICRSVRAQNSYDAAPLQSACLEFVDQCVFSGLLFVPHFSVDRLDGRVAQIVVSDQCFGTVLTGITGSQNLE